MKYIVTAAVIAIMAGVLAAQPVATGKVQIGASAPGWELKDLDGKTVRLSDFKGKKGVLMVFFATWCPVCMEEAPQVIAFRDATKSRRIEVIGIDLQQTAHVVKRFAEARKVNYTLALDTDGSVSQLYHVVGIPTVVGVDAGGTIRYLDHVLPKDREALVAQLESSGK